jgi:maleate isomerase
MSGVASGVSRSEGSAPLRLGILTPSSNTILEPATMRLAAPLGDRLSLHFARFPVTRIAADAESEAQFTLTSMLPAVRLLADARVDAYLWSGTSASWEGVETDEALVAAIRAETGRPATTSTLSLLTAFRALGVRRYALVVPYVASIAAAIERNLALAGYTSTATERHDLTTNWDFAAISANAVADGVRRVAASRPDAIAILCTNMRGAEVAAPLERELGIPVLDSVVVGFWGALRLLSIDDVDAGLGLGALAGATVARGPLAHA